MGWDGTELGEEMRTEEVMVQDLRVIAILLLAPGMGPIPQH